MFRTFEYITYVTTPPLKGGCTRFEVEHISCNLLLYIGKNIIKIGVQPSKIPKIAAFIWTFLPMFGRPILGYFGGCKILKIIFSQFLVCVSYNTIVSYMIYVQLQILCILLLKEGCMIFEFEHI